MNPIYFCILIFVICNFYSCEKNSNIDNGRYSLSHAYQIGNDAIVYPMPEDELLVKNDSVYYFEFEPYIHPKRGIIKNNYFVFLNGDSIRFNIENSIFKTYNDSLCFVWFIRR